MVEQLAQMSSVVFHLFVLQPLPFSDYPESPRVLLHLEQSSLDIKNFPEIPAHAVSLTFTVVHKCTHKPATVCSSRSSFSLECSLVWNIAGVEGESERPRGRWSCGARVCMCRKHSRSTGTALVSSRLSPQDWSQPEQKNTQSSDRLCLLALCNPKNDLLCPINKCEQRNFTISLCKHCLDEDVCGSWNRWKKRERSRAYGILNVCRRKGLWYEIVSLR